MKKSFMLGLISAVMLTLMACSNDDFPGMNSASGRLTVKLMLDNHVSTAEGSRTEYSEVTANDLTLRLTSADGAYEKEGTPAEFAEGLEVKVGTYTLEAFYGSSEEDGFGVPYFYGSQEITVTEKNITEVNLTATLANAMVSISYTDAFLKYFTSYSASVLSAASRTTAFAPAETRPAYIATGDCKVFVDITKPSGTSATLQPASFKAEARHHYKVTLDVNNGGVGDATLVISFSDDLNQEDVEIDLSDELMNAPAPTFAIEGYTPDTNGEIHLTAYDGTPLEVSLKGTIFARGGLKEVPMVTVSPALAAKGWPADINLMAATSAQQSLLKQAGLSVLGLWNNPDKMAVIDFSNVAKSLTYVEGENNQNRITLYVKDKYTKVSDPITIVIDVIKINMELGNQKAKEGEGTIEADLFYPGPDIASNVKMQVANNRGTWTNASYTYAPISSAASRSAAYNYHIVVTIPADAADELKLRAQYKSSYTTNSNEVNVPITPRELALDINNNDVWATKATVTVTSKVAGLTDAEAAAQSTVYVKTDGSDWVRATQSVSGNSIVITGLTPGTPYQVKAYLNDDPVRDSVVKSFTTESPLQVPNGDMEDWSSASSGKNWNCYVLGGDAANSVWGTNNPMTTSQGSDLAYTRATTTKPSSDAHGGKNAAWIRSMGWGSGNTAAGNLSSAKMKYGDPGLLHLGSSRSARPDGYGSTPGVVTTTDLNCGMAFASRPTSISFWYKYTPKRTDDTGEMEIWLQDAQGNVLFSATRSLASAGSYTKVEIPFTYPAGAAKAAKLYVKFLSTNRTDYLSKSTSNFTHPPFGNLSDGEYLGSQLWIDDIVLNY